MEKIIAVHSYRGGTGKSNTVVNLAALLAKRGLRVGLVDTDIQSPGAHILFGLNGEAIENSLNDYLWRGLDIRSVAHDMTAGLEAPVDGQIYLIPSSAQPSQIALVLRDGYDVEKLTLGFRNLIDELNLNVLLIDTHPGLNKETLLSLVIADLLLVVLRPDQQDYEGTGITLRVAQQLGVPEMLLLVNNTPRRLDPAAVQQKVADTYQSEVVAVMPHTDELMELGSDGIFALRFPDHPLTAQYDRIIDRILRDG